MVDFAPNATHNNQHFQILLEENYMVKTIAHLADIHIRKLHRFVEYRKVFKQLYKQLRVVKPDLIYIGGSTFVVAEII